MEVTMSSGLTASAQATTPLAWSRIFPARADQVREARAFLRAALDGCPAADDAILCISELAANADAPRGALLYPRCSREELKGGSWA
jgi:hypothetical protein